MVLFRILALVLVVVAAFGLPQFSATPDTRVFYGSKNPFLDDLNRYEAAFPEGVAAAIVVACEANCARLSNLLPDLTEKTKSLPYLRRVKSSATEDVVVDVDGVLHTKPLVEYLCHDCQDKSSVDRAVYEHLVGLLVNDATNIHVVWLEFEFDVGSTSAVEVITRSVSELLNDFEQPGLTFYSVGYLPLMQALVDATNNEIVGHMGLAILLLGLVAAIVVGDLKLLLVMFGTNLLSIVVTLGIASLFGLVVSTATASLPVILLTLNTATYMHYFMSIVRMYGEQPNMHVRDVANAALNSQWRPILLTSLFTFVCMVSLQAIDAPPLKDLGLWVGVGVLVSVLFLVTLAPPMVSVFKVLSVSRYQSWLQPKINRFAKNYRLSFAVVSVGFLGTVMSVFYLGSSVEIDDDYTRFFDSSTAFRADTEFVERELFGPYRVVVYIEDQTSLGVYSDEFVSFISRLTDRIEGHENVRSVSSYLDLIEQADIYLGSGVSENSASQTADSRSQLLFAYMMGVNEPDALDRYVSSDESSVSLTVMFSETNSLEIRNFKTKVEEFSETEGSKQKVSVTGETVPLAHLSSLNIPTMLMSIGTTFGLSAIGLAFFFRKARIAVVALLTTVVPVVIGFGVWTLFSPVLGIATTVVVTVCVGIVIDDFVHLAFSFFDVQKRLGLGPREAASYSIQRVGATLLTTTLILAIGFSVLIGSPFFMNVVFGACTILILVVALLIDLLISPALLMWSLTGEWSKSFEKVANR